MELSMLSRLLLQQLVVIFIQAEPRGRKFYAVRHARNCGDVAYGIFVNMNQKHLNVATMYYVHQ